MSVYAVDKLITQARRLAKEYREVTGKTLPVTGEVAINDAIRLLGMVAASELNCGYDAVLEYQQRKLKVQIKGGRLLTANAQDIV